MTTSGKLRRDPSGGLDQARLRGSAIAAAGEEAADRGAGAEAGELGQRAGEGEGEGEGELEGRVAARFDRGALAGGDVFHGAARDGARAVAADLDDEARDDGGLGDEIGRWGADELALRGLGALGRRGLGEIGLVAIAHAESVAWKAIRYTRRVLARWFALVALSACGRIGFGGFSDGADAAGAEDAGADAAGDDALPAPPGFVVSRTQLTTFAGFSWVALDVDWARSLAYVGTRETGHCVAVVDFANEAAPAIVRWIGDPSSVCLEVALLDPARLAVISSTGSAVALWSLGADPRRDAPVLIDEHGIDQPRHFSVDRSGTAPRLLVAVTDGLVEVEVGSGGLTFINSWPGGGCTGPYQTAVATGAQIVVGCQADNSQIEILERVGYAPVASLPNTGPGTTGSWNAITLADGRAVVLGWANVVVRDRAAVTRWQTTTGYRHIVAADADTVWTALDVGAVEVLSLATDGVARVIGRSSLGTGRDAYALRLAPSGRRGIAVTNRGYFVVFDPAQIAPSDIVYR